MDVWIVLIEDRHSDVEALPFSSEERAVAYARAQVEANARHPTRSSRTRNSIPLCARTAGCSTSLTARKAIAFAWSSAPWMRCAMPDDLSATLAGIKQAQRLGIRRSAEVTDVRESASRPPLSLRDVGA